jgi:MtN3 and saliva related transmembrane protein
MNTAVGLFAALCTTISYFPQLKKCWQTGSAGDLSLRMFLILALGVASWVLYGFLQRDLVIMIANSVSLCLLLGILYFKLRERVPLRESSGERRQTSECKPSG